MQYREPLMNTCSCKLVIVCAFGLALATGFCACTGRESDKKALPAGGPWPTILIAQAQFIYENRDGKQLPKPGPAVLTLKQKTPGGWKDTELEDPQSNVFHKAMILDTGSKKMILTIGAMQAALKLWELRGNSWQQTLLWNPAFGGKWDRLRDVEIGDVTGDGSAEIVMATHDQGVVAVAAQRGQSWNISEIDREPEIFIHEVEIGDIDGDGKKEFFVTPSHPNKARGGPQPGKVVMYRWNGSGFAKTVVDSYDKTHAKEILVCDIDGRGVSTLFSVFEAETRREGDRLVRVEPVKIKQYSFTGGSVSNKVIATIDDFQCRFLTAGDIDGDGEVELVAAAMKTGLWLLKRRSGSWQVTLIDADSSGYEHATCLADLDKNGTREIYVAADDQQEFRRYSWNGNSFSKTVLSPIPRNRITWNVTAGTF